MRYGKEAAATAGVTLVEAGELEAENEEVFPIPDIVNSIMLAKWGQLNGSQDCDNDDDPGNAHLPMVNSFIFWGLS